MRRCGVSEGLLSSRLALKFKKHPQTRPSDWVEENDAVKNGEYVIERFKRSDVNGFGVQVHGYGEYPSNLRDAQYPAEVLYYEGRWDLVFSPSIAVVGTRKPSEAGIKRTQELVRQLVAGRLHNLFGTSRWH